MKLNLLKSITSTKRLEDSIEEVEKELQAIQPEIERLEKAQVKLRELKLAKQKLITLKLSLKSILENFDESKDSGTNLETSEAFRSFIQRSHPFAQSSLPTVRSADNFRIFIPDKAFAEAGQVLKQKSSLNIEIFRAIAFYGGRASTQQIKDYLIRNNIKQPSSGEGFETVELTDISSRINYLVRKGIVVPEGRGHFASLLGWQDTSQDIRVEGEVTIGNLEEE